MAKFINIDTINGEIKRGDPMGTVEEVWINTDHISSFCNGTNDDRRHMTSMIYVVNGKGMEIFTYECAEHLAMRINEL